MPRGREVKQSPVGRRVCRPIAPAASWLDGIDGAYFGTLLDAALNSIQYPKFKLSPGDREELLADYLPYCRSVRMPASLPKLPVCRDANDQMFVELAAIGKADWLVTGDENLLVMAGEFDRPMVRIVTAEVFLRQLEGEGNQV